MSHEWNIKPKHRRALIVAIAFICSTIATSLGLHVFSKNMVYFKTPSQLDLTTISKRDLKLGGMVVAHSYHHQTINHTPENIFEVTDGKSGVMVHYKGILPDLFREGQSVVAIGKYLPDQKFFDAHQVLAKHDETYMPKEVADALQKTGKWDPRFGPAPSKEQWQTMIHNR